MSGSNLDPSIALNTAGVQAIRDQQNQPFQQVANYAQTADAMLSLKQRQQSLASTMAIGRATQQAINPDGTVNQDKFRSLVAQDPNAAYGAQAAIGTSQDQQDQAYKVNSAALSQSTARAGVFSTALAPLLGEGNNVQPSDVYGVVARLHAAGLPVDEMVDQIGSTMPHQGGAALRHWIAQNATGSGGLSTSDALPKAGFVNTGGAETSVDTNPITNPNITRTNLPLTLSPGEAIDQVKLTAPDGTTYSVPRAQLAQLQGQGALVGPNGAPGGGNSVFGSGRYGQGGSAGGGTAGGAPGSPFEGQGGGSISAFGATPPGAPPGAITTGISPASNAARTVLGTQAGDEAAGLFSQAQGVPNRKAMLSDMESDIANAPTGPGAQNQAFWSAFANRNFGNLSRLVGGSVVQTPDQVASFENFEKMAGRFAQDQATTLGTVTNDKLGSAMASNPNAAFSALGNQGVIHILQGNEDAIAAKNNAWQSYLNSGGDPAKYQQWSTQFNNSGFDPHTFWMKNLTPDERSKYIGTLSPTQQSGLYANMRTAFKNGWASPSDFAPPSSSSTGAPSTTSPPSASGPSVPVGSASGY